MAVITIPQFRALIWNFTRLLLFLIALSRVWAILVTYNVVPTFPDPVLAGIAHLYVGFDAVIEGGLGGIGNVLMGSLVFGMLLRFYAPRKLAGAAAETASGELSKEGEGEGEKEEKKKEKEKGRRKTAAQEKEKEKEKEKKAKGIEKSNIDIRMGTPESSLKRNVIIAGRLAQCALFLAQSYYRSTSNGGSTNNSGYSSEEAAVIKETTKDVTLRSAELAASVVLAVLEIAGVKWDLGLAGALFELVGLRGEAWEEREREKERKRKEDAGKAEGEGEGMGVGGKKKEDEVRLKLRLR